MRIGSAVIASTLAFGALGCATSPAIASPAAVRNGSPIVVSRVDMPMHVGAIDADQAKRVGNRVLYKDGFQILLDGKTGSEIARVRTARVKATGNQAQAITPNTTVAGNCGSSYIDLVDSRQYDNVYKFITGFTVNGSAYDFNWYVAFEAGNGGYWTWSDSGPQWPGSSWTSNWVDEYTAYDGWVKGYVESSSRAYLTDGRVCWTGGPSDSEWVS